LPEAIRPRSFGPSRATVQAWRASAWFHGAWHVGSVLAPRRVSALVAAGPHSPVASRPPVPRPRTGYESGLAPARGVDGCLIPSWWWPLDGGVLSLPLGRGGPAVVRCSWTCARTWFGSVPAFPWPASRPKALRGARRPPPEVHVTGRLPRATRARNWPTACADGAAAGRTPSGPPDVPTASVYSRLSRRVLRPRLGALGRREALGVRADRAREPGTSRCSRILRRSPTFWIAWPDDFRSAGRSCVRPRQRGGSK